MYPVVRATTREHREQIQGQKRGNGRVRPEVQRPWEQQGLEGRQKSLLR